jgi:hypothetical protein
MLFTVAGGRLLYRRSSFDVARAITQDVPGIRCRRSVHGLWPRVRGGWPSNAGSPSLVQLPPPIQRVQATDNALTPRTPPSGVVAAHAGVPECRDK